MIIYELYNKVNASFYLFSVIWLDKSNTVFDKL